MPAEPLRRLSPSIHPALHQAGGSELRPPPPDTPAQARLAESPLTDEPAAATQSWLDELAAADEPWPGESEFDEPSAVAASTPGESWFDATAAASESAPDELAIDAPAAAEPWANAPGVRQIDFYLSRFPRHIRSQRGLSENTERGYMADLQAFREYLGREGLSLTDMDRATLRAYLAWLATLPRDGGKGYARVSVSRKLTVLRAFYRFLVQEGLFRSTPVPSGRSFRLKVSKTLPTFLAHREAARLMDAPDEDTPVGLRDKAILELLYSCGVRLAEIHDMDLPDVKFSERTALVRGKGSKERQVIFGRPSEQALQRYLTESRPLLLGETRPHQALFLNRYGQRLSRRSYEKLVRQYSVASGGRDDVHPHTLRHTFATHMLEGGADLRVIQELMGHSSPSTTQLYTHITKQEALAAYLTHHPRADAPANPNAAAPPPAAPLDDADANPPAAAPDDTNANPPDTAAPDDRAAAAERYAWRVS